MQLTILAAGLTTSVLILGACAANPGVSDPSEPPKLSSSEIAEALETPDLFFLDVRSPDELEQNGTIEGYVNIPIAELESRLDEIPKDRPVLTA